MMYNFYFIFRTRNEAGIITSMGFSPVYEKKEEMWENLEFQRLCGYECIPKVEEVF